MPRISRELAAQKEAFVLGLLASNPAITMKEIQDEVKTKFGANMNAVKIGQLKAKLANKDSPVVAATEAEQAAVEPITATTEVVEAPAPVLAMPSEAPTPDKTTVVEPVVTTYVQTTTLDESGRPVTAIRPGTMPEVAGAEVELRTGLTEVVVNG
jgi:hypothetical protein